LWFRLAATHRFIHVSSIGVLARSHEGQGTHRMKDTVLIECDELLGGFVQRLSSDELRHAASKPPAEALFDLACNLAQRGFFNASRRALERGRTSVRASISDMKDERTGSGDTSYLAALENVEAVARLAETFVFERLEALRVAASAQSPDPQACSAVAAPLPDQPSFSVAKEAMPWSRSLSLAKGATRKVARRLPPSTKAQLRVLWRMLSANDHSIPDQPAPREGLET